MAASCEGCQKQISTYNSGTWEERRSICTACLSSYQQKVAQEPLVDDLMRFSQMMQGMLKGGHADVLIRSRDGVELPAHRCVLAAWSPVFAAMFKSSFSESNGKATVNIDDTSASTLKLLLSFMYSGSLSLDTVASQATTTQASAIVSTSSSLSPISFRAAPRSSSLGVQQPAPGAMLPAKSPAAAMEDSAEEHCFSLLAAAEKYGVTSLKEKIEEWLCDGITEANAFQALRMADLYNAEDLKEAASEYIMTKMERGVTLTVLRVS